MFLSSSQGTGDNGGLWREREGPLNVLPEIPPACTAYSHIVASYRTAIWSSLPFPF